MVDGARIGDVPARYVVRGLQGHELPVVGTYVDPNIVTGFCYQVRPVDAKKALFQVRRVSSGLPLTCFRGFMTKICFRRGRAFSRDSHEFS